MGTNYYIEFPRCSCCGHSEPDYHIGKSSAGWCFALHVDKEKGINSLEDLKKLFIQCERIRDEYGMEISKEEMLNVITKRSWAYHRGKNPPASYKSQEEFYKLNSAIEGPNNLLRAKVDGYHCIEHGEGTYDYIVGEFS